MLAVENRFALLICGRESLCLFCPCFSRTSQTCPCLLSLAFRRLPFRVLGLGLGRVRSNRGVLELHRDFVYGFRELIRIVEVVPELGANKDAEPAIRGEVGLSLAEDHCSNGCFSSAVIIQQRQGTGRGKARTLFLLLVGVFCFESTSPRQHTSFTTPPGNFWRT